MRKLILIVLLLGLSFSAEAQLIHRQVEPEADPISLHLDQNIPQTIINGIPLLELGRTINANQQLVDKEYVDLAVSSLQLTEFYSANALDPVVAGYYEMCSDLPGVLDTVTSAEFSYSVDPTSIFNFLTSAGEPALDRLPIGTYTSHVHIYRATGNKLVRVYYELWKMDSAGADIAKLGTSSTTAFFGDGVAQIKNIQMVLQTEATLALTDRLAVKWFAYTEAAGSGISVSMEVGGAQDSSFGINVSPLELESIFVPYSGAIENVNLGVYELYAGAIGVGTTNPVAALDVVGDVHLSNDLLLDSTAVISFASSNVSITHSTDGLAFTGADNGYTFDDKVKFAAGKPVYFDSGGDTWIEQVTADQLKFQVGGVEAMRIVESESVASIGIGTTNPDNALDVVGAVSIGTLGIGNTAPANGLIVQGNVGIGTTNPSTALQVVGTITGDLTGAVTGNASTASNLSGTPNLPNGTTATTQAPADNSTKLATTAYADTAAAGGGATAALDNLASVQINTSLLSDTADTDSLGTVDAEWANLYIGDAGKIYFGLGQDASINRNAANEMTITATSGVTISDGLVIDAGALADNTVDSDDFVHEDWGEVTNASGSVVIDDSVAVASWNLTTPTITTSLTTDSKTISEAELGILDGGIEGEGEILSTGEAGASKYLREDGDGTCSWQTPAGGGSMNSFILEDADGTEVEIDDAKEVKFIESTGIDIDWTDTSDGTDADPFDLTFTIAPDAIAGAISAGAYANNSVQAADIGGETGTGNPVFSANPSMSDIVCADTLLMYEDHDTPANAFILSMRKARDGDPTDNVSDDDTLGYLRWEGYGGDTGYYPGAIIKALADGDTGAEDMPSRLEFLTSADASATPTLAMTISSAQVVTFANDLADSEISDTLTASTCTGNSATVTTTDNEDVAENDLIPFVADAAGPGSSALETDGDFYYTPSTGKVTATGFVGALTGNADTVTNATLTTALTVNTGTLTLTADAGNDSVLTIGGGAVSVSGSNTGDNSGTDDQTLAEVLGEGADANDVDTTSWGKMEGFDAGLYLDWDADGVIDLTSDGTLELHSNDWDISTTGAITNAEIDADNNTVSNIVIGAECTGASTSLTDTADITYNADSFGGELGGTIGSPTIADSVAVTSWNLTTPTITTSIDLPAGAINTATEIAADIITYTQTLDADQRDTKCVTIETPADADDFLWFRCDTAYTVISIDAICEAATSAVVVVNECDSAGDNCGAANTKLEESITADVDGQADDGTLGNPGVAAGDWLRLQVGTIVGTPGHVTTCVTYNYDD